MKQTVVIYWMDFNDRTNYDNVSIEDARKLLAAVGSENVVRFNFTWNGNGKRREACLRMETVRMVSYGEGH